MSQRRAWGELTVGPGSTPRWPACCRSDDCRDAVASAGNAERRPAEPAGPPLAECGSERADVLRLRALLALGDVELHLLILVEAAEAARRDRGEVSEDVGAAVVRADKAEALVGVEPLHGTCSHVCSFVGDRTVRTRTPPR